MDGHKPFHHFQWDVCLVFVDCPNCLIAPPGNMRARMEGRSHQTTTSQEDRTRAMLSHSLDTEVRLIVELHRLTRPVEDSVNAGLWNDSRSRLVSAG